MKRKILIIDDEGAFAGCLKEFFESAGHEAHMATSASEAFAKLDEQGASFEVVVSDVNMPGITGMTLLKAIKTRNPLIQVILMSGYGTESMIVQGLENGALDFLAKPFELKVIGEIVKAIDAKLQRWNERGVTIKSGNKNG